RVLLISTYELGRQPFGLASPAAWLRADGYEVRLADLSREPLPLEAIANAELVGFFLPMHTATRLFPRVVQRVRALNSHAHLCAYGLYAPLNRELLRQAGVRTIIGGEFEEPLRDLARGLAAGQDRSLTIAAQEISLERQRFLVPDRSGLPVLSSYAQLAVN